MNKQIKILLIDDDEDDFIITKSILQEIKEWNFEIDWEKNYQEAQNKLFQNQHDLYLIDFRLGEGTGLDLLNKALKNNIKKPIIILTGQGDRQIDLEVMQAGAADYLIKESLDSINLERSIRYSLNNYEISKNLAESEKQLQLKDKLSMTGRLARSIAHEVRNPLTNINLSLEELEHELKNDDLKPYIDIIQRNSKRIEKLISDLLNSSKPSKLQLNSWSINKIIEDTLSLAQDRMDLKNIQLIKFFEPDLCEIKVDNEQVKIALLNIIINAIEAMEENKGILKISTFSEKDKCIVIIEDNGIGMSEEQVDRLFEPFFTGKKSGTGLGMTSAQNIINNHNGSIDVNSKKGEGTIFKISFSFD